MLHLAKTAQTVWLWLEPVCKLNLTFNLKINAHLICQHMMTINELFIVSGGQGGGGREASADGGSAETTVLVPIPPIDDDVDMVSLPAPVFAALKRQTANPMEPNPTNAKKLKH